MSVLGKPVVRAAVYTRKSSDEISSENLYEIKAFVTSFLKHLDELAKEEKKAEEEKEPEISEEEQLRLAVIEIQKLLNAAGCNAGIADGIWGRRTQAAAVLFAKTAKLPTNKDNLINDEFLNKLRVAPTNFCPKPKRAKTEFYASYNYSCKGKRIGTLTVQKQNKSQAIFKLAGSGSLWIYFSRINVKNADFGFNAKSHKYKATLNRNSSGRVNSIRLNIMGNICQAKAR